MGIAETRSFFEGLQDMAPSAWVLAGMVEPGQPKMEFGVVGGIE